MRRKCFSNSVCPNGSRPVAVSSVEPLSTTMTSRSAGLFSARLERHWRVSSQLLNTGMMTETGLFACCTVYLRPERFAFENIRRPVPVFQLTVSPPSSSGVTTRQLRQHRRRGERRGAPGRQRAALADKESRDESHPARLRSALHERNALNSVLKALSYFFQNSGTIRIRSA